ncbi:hypothetical protein NDU88_001845 [Pleurodeles waltl]|uniref:Uncharacterized protein n=1 Tax=Pleurodeles waltl TaxID=8319 RepID=A0AAV7KSI9_PLEWA|nr:hypothetical protein NDU88_001845 [Pleurodeles waltl]
MGVPEARKECPMGTEQSWVSPGGTLLTPALEEEKKMLQDAGEYAQQETKRRNGEVLERQGGDKEREDGVLWERTQEEIRRTEKKEDGQRKEGQKRKGSPETPDLLREDPKDWTYRNTPPLPGGT